MALWQCVTHFIGPTIIVIMVGRFLIAFYATQYQNTFFFFFALFILSFKTIRKIKIFTLSFDFPLEAIFFQIYVFLFKKIKTRWNHIHLDIFLYIYIHIYSCNKLFGVLFLLLYKIYIYLVNILMRQSMIFFLCVMCMNDKTI